MKSQIVVIFLFVTLSSARSWLPPIWDTSCKFTREDAFKCIQQTIDLNHDDQITREEVETAIGKIPYVIRKVWSWAMGIDGIFRVCDYDHNGIITPRDFKLSKDTCLAKKKYLCTVEWLCNQ